MNRKRIIQIGLVVVIIVVIMGSLHLGGPWVVETFKEMHGL